MSEKITGKGVLPMASATATATVQVQEKRARGIAGADPPSSGAPLQLAVSRIACGSERALASSSKHRGQKMVTFMEAQRGDPAPPSLPSSAFWPSAAPNLAALASMRQTIPASPLSDSPGYHTDSAYVLHQYYTSIA